jgi:hypothetical protein
MSSDGYAELGAELVDRFYPPGSLTPDERERAKNDLATMNRSQQMARVLEVARDNVARGLPDDLASRVRNGDGFSLVVERLGNINASASRGSTDEWIVRIDEGMVTALYGVARTLSARISTGPAGCEACNQSACRTESIARTARRLMEYGLRGVWHGDCGAEDWPIRFDQLQMADAVAHEAETFVLAHEIGHQTLDHPDGQQAIDYTWEITIESADLRDGPKIELLADGHGATIMLNSVTTRLADSRITNVTPGHLVPAIYGVETFLAAADLLDRCQGQDPSSRDHDDDRRCHVSSSIRRTIVQAMWERTIANAGVAYGLVSRSWRSTIENCWATLASPGPHDLLAWQQDWRDAQAAVGSLLARIEGMRELNEDFIREARRVRASCSQLMFDRALLDHVATSRSGVSAKLAEQIAFSRSEAVRAVDPTAPVLGLGHLVFAGPVESFLDFVGPERP